MSRRQRQPNANLLTRLTQVDFSPPWTAPAAALTIVFAILVLIVGTTAAFVWLGENAAATLVGWLLGGVIMSLLVWQTRARERSALGLGASGTPLALVMFIGIGAAIGIDILGLAVTRAFLPVPELLGLSLNALNTVDLVLAGILLILVQPISEELVFRAVGLPAFRAALGGWAGLLVTSLAFGVFHWVAYTPTYSAEFGSFTPYWYGLIAPTLAGLFYGGVRVTTGSTRAAIAAHAAFGIFAIFKLLVLAN